MSRRPSKPNTQTPEEIALWVRIRAELKEQRRQRREHGHRETYESATLKYEPPYQGLKRGPKPDLARVCTNAVLTARVTDREAKALRKHHNKLCKDASPSTFFRFVVCQWLEAHRDKAKDPEPFAFDPTALDWRTQTRKKAL